jgi:hypothetical protein
MPKREAGESKATGGKTPQPGRERLPQIGIKPRKSKWADSPSGGIRPLRLKKVR